MRDPQRWIGYDGPAITNALAEAKAAVLSLRTVPYQRRWVEGLQQIQLKREVAGTCRIEGAEFTERELEAAMQQTPEQLQTQLRKGKPTLLCLNVPLDRHGAPRPAH